MKIHSFRREYRFLSNFFEPYNRIVYEGIPYPTAEHAYQAAKAIRGQKLWKEYVADLSSPQEAKKAGRHVRLRKDWEEIKTKVMSDIVSIKFNSNPTLAQMLLNTGDAELVEGNTWGDTFWGVCGGVGRNELGKILMQVRKELRKGEA